MKKRNSEEDSKQFVKCPIELVRCGRALSNSAKLVYIVIASYNPSYPGLRTIGKQAGLSTYSVHFAIEELLNCRLILKVSGKQARENNQYRLFPVKQWKLPEPKKREQKGGVRKKADLVDKAPPHLNRLGEQGTADLVTKPRGNLVTKEELDQLESDQLITNGAQRHSPITSEGGVESSPSEGEGEQRSPNGQDPLPPAPPEGGDKGVASSGDALAKVKADVASVLENCDRLKNKESSEKQFLEEQRALLIQRKKGSITKREYQTRVRTLAEELGIELHVPNSTVNERPQNRSVQGNLQV